jgi:hypothetical protein
MSAEYRRARANDSARLAEMRLAMRVEGEEAYGPDEGDFLNRCAEYYRSTVGDSPRPTGWRLWKRGSWAPSRFTVS